jgi:hypothetical protein
LDYRRGFRKRGRRACVARLKGLPPSDPFFRKAA